MKENEIVETILGCAIKVHSALGPGLLESTFEICLIHELSNAGVRANRQVPLPLIYDGVELKVVEKLLPLHTAQLLSYLKLSKRKLGYLLNFNVVQMRDGIKRVVNNL